MQIFWVLEHFANSMASLDSGWPPTRFFRRLAALCGPYVGHVLRIWKYAVTQDRTGDLQIFSLTLSQLSYRGLIGQ